jgi:radical SAM superfamily enzyme YgiQ (UPF0313 family)
MYSSRIQRFNPIGFATNNMSATDALSSKPMSGPVVLVSKGIEFTFPLAYAYLAGYLKQVGEDVRVVFKRQDADGLVNEIMSLNPVLVGFGSLYPELRETGDLITMLNQAGRKFPIVIGGQMVTPTPEFALKVTGADFGIIGEGEITLHSLVTAIREGRDTASIRGLAIRRGDQIVSTGPGEVIENLDNLPPVPYEMFPTEKWLPIGVWYAKNCPQPHWKIEDRVINVHGGRGCPFTCNFCYHHSKPRYRSIEVMMDEAQASLKRFDGNMLYFSDDLVLASPKRARELVEHIRRLDRPVSYSISARFDILARIDDALLGEMKETGLRIVGLGIESGSDRMLEIIGKNCTATTIRCELSRLKKFDILPTVTIMLGQYTETVEDVEASIDLMRDTVRENPLINYAFTVTTPFPGSKLYDLIMQHGYLRDDQHFYDIYFSAGGGDFKQIVNLSAINGTVNLF